MPSVVALRRCTAKVAVGRNPTAGLCVAAARVVRAVALAAALAAALASAAHAAEHRFQLLLDTDDNAATGCAVSTSAGPAGGVEQAWTTVVTTSPSGATVTRIERQTCSGTTLGAPTVFATAGWPAGLGHGTSGTAALETYVPLSLLPTQGTVRMRVASTNATGGQDASAAFPIVIGAVPPSPPASPARPIPLSPWLIPFLAVAVLASAAWMRRRHPDCGPLVLWIVLAMVSGLAWAATVTLDGNVGDWSGVNADVTNPASSAPIDAKIVAVFHQSDTINLYVRIDADVRADAAGNQAPTVSAGADQTITLPASASLIGTASDDGLPNPPGALTITWSQASGPGTVTFGNLHALATSASFPQSGVYVLRLTASDGALSASDDVQITVNDSGNQSPVAAADTVETSRGFAVQLNVLANDTDPDGDRLQLITAGQGAHGAVTCRPDGTCSYAPQPSFAGQDTFTYIVGDTRGGHATGTVTVNVVTGDPTIVAPLIKGPYITTLGKSTRFLYTGANPPQTGVAPGTIDDRRVAVLRGKVTTREGGALPGVTVTVLDHAEFGQTTTRSNGGFDMAVNGGARLTIKYAAPGFLPLQKQVSVPWQDYVGVPSVALIPLDTHVTVVTANAPTAQVHQGGVMADNDGSRRATVFVPSGTTATMLLPNHSTQPLATMHLRATEYTVGPNGPVAMPAQLPPLSGYTYCVELSMDEAIATGALGVTFNQPVVTYAENFLAFPVGINVPVGIYDRAKAVWVPSTNGRVVKIVAIAAGLADVDTDGDGVADNGLGITVEERQNLATLYPVGRSLWRVPVVHFSPADSNWPFSIPTDAVAPSDSGAGPDPNEPLQEPRCSSGSIVECENQTLGESVPIVGTPFTLNYRSDRMQGLVATRNIRLSGASVPASLASIGVHLAVAGRSFDRTFPAVPNQQMAFVWDRLDAYGRQVLGGQTLSVRIDYNYPTSYTDPGPQPQNFNSVGTVTLAANPTRQEISVSQSFTTTIGEGLTDARVIGLGGWTLSGHQVYDPNARVVHLGNGSRIRAGSIARTLGVTHVTGQSILFDVEVGADGARYIALPHGDVIVRVGVDGTQTVVAGNGTEGFSGDGGPATLAKLGDPTGIAFGPDGSLYIAEEANFRVRKVATDGTITTIAGTGVATFSGDGGPATQAGLVFAERIAVGADSSIYLLDGQRVRRITPDGIINTVAGNGVVGSGGDGGPATSASLNASSISPAADGSFYIADFGNHRVRRVGTDGIIDTVVDYTSSQGRPVSVRPTRDGGLLIALEFATARTPQVDLLRPDGTTVTVAGGGPSAIANGIPATQANLVAIRAVALSPDGAIHIVRGGSDDAIVRVSPALPGFEGTEHLIASPDGRQLYVFDPDGKHLRTVSALTGAVLFEYGYDADGLLVTVTEKTGGTDNVTTIQHNASGNPTAIVGPFGHTTTLAVDANGFLTHITNPAGETIGLASDAGGLLTSFTDARGKTSTFAFDADGHLLSDTDPVGGSQTLARTTSGNQFSVTRTSALGRVTTYATQNRLDNRQIRTTTKPDSTQSRTDETIDSGTMQATAADGTVIDSTLGPDPRFGMASAVPTSTRIALPGGLALAGSHTLTAQLSNASDPLSLVGLTDASTVNGRTTTTTFDAATKTFATTTPAGRTASVTIDAFGRAVANQVNGLDSASFSYDARGRISTVTHGTGVNARTVSFGYAANGFLQSVTDPIGRTVQFNYDAVGRVVSKILPDGRVTSFGYDAAGNITSIVPPGRPAHALAYSDRGELVTATPPSVTGTGPSTYSYDLDGQITKVSRPDGHAVAFGYDAGGRLTSRSLMNGNVVTSTDTLSYDSAGRPASIATAAGVTTGYAYDGSLQTGWSWSGLVAGSVTRTFDASFRMASESVNAANTVNLTYDNDDLLIGVGPLSISRNAQNGLATGTSLGVVATTATYNGFGEATGSAATASGNPLFSDSLTRDRLGRILQKTETIGGVTDVYAYVYDTAGNLSSVTRNAVASEAYVYDGNGNRTSATIGVTPVSATYDDQDRLAQYGSTTFVYNAAGDLSTKTSGAQTTSYQYDALGNLLTVTLPSGTTIAYVVDGDNRRIAKKVNNALVKAFLYRDALRPVAELDGAGALVSRFIYAGGNAPVAMVKAGITYRFIADASGSIRLVVDGTTGAVAQRIDYDTFGNVVADSNPGFQPFGFAGGLYDPDTHLVRFGARDYDPSVGRWTSKDPLGFAGDDTNLYRYARNDPVNRRDPFGLLDRTQCNTLRSLLAYEDAHGTWQTAREFSETFGKRLLGTLGDDASVPTVLGPIDIDWYTDLVYATGAGDVPLAIGGAAAAPGGPEAMVFGAVGARTAGVTGLYVFGKIVWNAYGLASGTRDHFRAPFNDPKEGVAVKALVEGYSSYHDLFPDAFLNSLCSCAR